MKSRVTPWILIGLCFHMLTGPVSGAEGELGDLVSAEAAERVGLKLQWTTHLQVNPAYGKIAHITQHISSKRSKTVFEISFLTRKETISELDLDTFGTAYGIEGARAAADRRVEVLAANGIEATVTEVVLPQITLYCLTDQALVQAIDGESGQTLWTAPVGKRTNPPTPISADDDFVAVVNGMSIYFLEAETGHIAWKKRLSQAPGSGPAISRRYTFVPLLNGMVEAFPMWDSNLPSESFKTVGRNYVQPASTGETVSWSNDRGHLNVAYSDQIRNVSFRVEASKDFLSPAVPLGIEELVSASSDGYVHCVHERSGRVVWTVSTGERIENSPFAVEDAVFVATKRHNLFRIPVANPTFDWVIPGIQEVISVSERHIYCQGSNNDLVILNRDSGARVDALQLTDVDFWYTNRGTDRIFVGTQTGLLQCLREVESNFPAYTIPLDARASDEDEDDSGAGGGNIFRATRGDD